MGIIIKWGGEVLLPTPPDHALTNSLHAPTRSYQLPPPPWASEGRTKNRPPPQVSTDCAHPPVFQISTSPTTDRTTRKGNHFGNGFGDVGQPVGAGLVRVGVSWGWGWVCGDGDGDGDGEGMGLVMGMTAVMGMW
jgi:hypothetical protein